MRLLSTLTIVLLAFCGAARAQTCVGTATTTISGVVYAPNGTDPLPNVTVYIPLSSAPVPLPAFSQTPGVSCQTVGTPPVDASAVGTTTAVDGTFTLTGVPVSSSVPIVAVSGKWRVQGTVDTTGAACGNTVDNLTMPQNHTQGDIPLIAIATGSADQVECVLLKMGISQSEFTDPGGGGQINLFGGGGAAGSGVTIDSGTPTQASLMANSSMLNQYDALMLPCEGANITKPLAELQNLVAFANDGGRVYASHFSYSWMYNNPPFNNVANWIGGTASNSVATDPGVATVDTSFTAGQTLATWLQQPVIGATTIEGQMAISTLRKDTNGVIPPTQTWLTLNNSAADNPVMQFVFDTPIPSTVNPTPNQCGRVLYNEYHVENSSVKAGTVFPNECDLSAAMTPQEKLLEYMLFELTSEGGQPTLAPTAQDFGSEAVNYASAPQSFTWTNNSSFALSVSSATITGTNAGDFNIRSNGCSAQVAGGASCTITVVFTPTILGAETATLSVASSGTPLIATLTGTGVPGFSASASTLSFGNVVASESSQQLLTLTSNATDPQPVPSTAFVGNYTVSTAACANPVPALGTCVATVTFSPTALGVQTGTLTVNSSGSPLTVALSGMGVPGFSLSPTLNFGNQDVGFPSAPQTLTLTSVGTGPLVVPQFVTTGPYSVSAAACGSMLAAGATCPVAVIFTPTTTGPLSGTVAANSTNPVYSGLNASLSGNGVDFTITLNPASGTVVAGDAVATTATLTPLAGFAAQLSVSCSVTGAAALACTPGPVTVAPNATATFGITTTSQYTVVGYDGFGGGGYLWLVAMGSGWLLWMKRRSRRALLRAGLLAVLLAAMGIALTGCTGKLPAENALWTGAGNYSVTVTATDGSLVHSATYNLTVTQK